MIAAMVMGESVLPPPDSFDAMAFIVAMLIHFLLSVILALIFGWIISRWNMGLVAAVILGIGFGLAVYVLNIYGLTAVFPWFADARGWIAILSHAMFGLVLGAVYQPLWKRDERKAATLTRVPIG